MKKVNLKNKLKQNKVTVGSWITIGNEIIVEIMSKMNFDWLVIDMEHSTIGLQTAQNLVRIIESNGVNSLVRVGENNANLIKKAMDTGADGVIVPMVNSKEEAERAVGAVKYPPQGRRGVGLARAQGYGTAFEAYKKRLKKDSIVIVQIEHIDAVENIDEILQVKGVDGFIVGPYDLSGSVGHPGQFDHPQVVQALKKVMEASKRLKVPAGYHVIPPEPKELNRKIKEGFRFLSFSLDTLVFTNSYESLLKKINVKGN